MGSAARGASASTEGGEGRGHIGAAARLQLVIVVIINNISIISINVSFPYVRG